MSILINELGSLLFVILSELPERIPGTGAIEISAESVGQRGQPLVFYKRSGRQWKSQKKK
jgi:hypothetical protein